MRKRKLPKPITTEADGMITRDPGIFTETMLDGNAPANVRDARIQEARAQLAAEPKYQRTALEQIEALRQRMSNTLSLYRTLFDRMAAVLADDEPLTFAWATINADLGNGPEKFLAYAPRAAGVQRAADTLRMIEAFLCAEPTEPKAKIFLSGMGVGRLLTEMEVLPSEPDALQGKLARTSRPETARNERSVTLKDRRDWARGEYAATLTLDPKDKAGARRRVRKAFKIKYPAVKPPALSTIEAWVRTPRRNGRKK